MTRARRHALPAPTSGVLIGMSADDWETRLAEVGPGLKARRLFGQVADFNSPSTDISRANAELAAGRVPVFSFKTPAWTAVAAGTYDTQLTALHNGFAALPGTTYLTLHHEPGSDGAAADWAAMQLHAIPILKAPNVKVGVIVNGFWWNAQGGKSDAFIGEYLPPELLAILDYLGGDFYQSAAGTEEPAPKLARFVAWGAARGIRSFGIGEYNSFTTSGAGIKAVGDLVLADSRFAFANVWNTEAERSAVLVGARLDAFKATVLAGA